MTRLRNTDLNGTGAALGVKIFNRVPVRSRFKNLPVLAIKYVGVLNNYAKSTNVVK
jgi:hypothetical protein